MGPAQSQKVIQGLLGDYQVSVCRCHINGCGCYNLEGFELLGGLHRAYEHT